MEVSADYEDKYDWLRFDLKSLRLYCSGKHSLIHKVEALEKNLSE